MVEVWKDIPMYTGIYEVSTLGRVRSKVTNEFAKPFRNDKGYMIVKIYLNGQVKNERVHRLVALTFISNPHNYPQVNHIDYDRTNNRVDNLEWCTGEQNIRHSIDHFNCKSVYCNGKTFRSIGECCRHFNVPDTTMRSWLSGKRKMPKFYRDGGLSYAKNS